MSNSEQGRATSCRAEQVAKYLERYPKFFAKHEYLLDSLYIPHDNVSGATSLLERLVERQRAKQSELEQQMDKMMQDARENERILQGLHTLALELLSSTSVESVVHICRTVLKEQFQADEVVFRLIGSGEQHTGLNYMVLDDITVRHLSHLFNKRQPVCGRLRSRQRKFLFGESSEHIQSAVMIPLFEEGEVGVLAIGSVDEDRFYPGIGMLFINQLGSLVSRALVRHSDAGLEDSNESLSSSGV